MPKTEKPRQGLLISVEGVSTQGATGAVLDTVGGTAPQLLTGCAWHEAAAPTYDMMAALARWAGSEVFVHGGRLESASALQLAFLAHRYESARPDLAAGRTVVEQHGVHSLAVHLAFARGSTDLATAVSTARAVVAAATLWRPLPDVVVLVENDAVPSEHRHAALAQRVFAQLAADDPTRFIVMDGTAESLAELDARVNPPRAARTGGGRTARAHAHS